MKSHQSIIEQELRSSRDATDWLVLADMLEERGDDEESRRWRQEGEWARVIFPLWSLLAHRGYQAAESWNWIKRPLTDDFEVWCRRTRYFVITRIRNGDGFHDFHIRYFHIKRVLPPLDSLPFEGDIDLRDWRYVRRRFRDVCNYYVHSMVTIHT